ncbi:L-aminoadipate-semialdehyde dehydrogenase [Meredithblackwellia eburnea MCA 4105]
MTAPKHVFKSVTEMIKTQSKQYKDSVVLGVPDKDLKIQLYTYAQLELAINLLATHYATIIPTRPKRDTTSVLRVALLAPSGYDYAVTEMALSRLGYAVLFISINNSPPAIAHLCHETKSSFLVVAPQYVELARESLAAGAGDIEMVNMPDPEVYGKKAQKENPDCVFEEPLTPDEEGPLTAFIVHSSGSTGFPKPIYITHTATAFNVSLNFGLEGFTTLPVYHNHGHSCLYRALYSVKPLHLFPASELPLTTANVLRILEQPECGAEALFGVPYVYKLLGETDEGIERLKQFKLCLYGGSAMPTELGDKLVASGVRLVGHYGATEVSQLSTSFRDYDTDKEWEYQRIGPALLPFAYFEDRGGNQFELIVKDGWKGKVKSNRPDNSYATSDLFEPHPTRENLWRFVGRIDDTLVLVNGEKVNPVPMEGTIRGDSPYVAEVIVFGSERSQAGVLILPSDAVPLNATRDELLELVRPVVVAANAAAPSHSRLSDELVVFLPRGSVVPKADKGSIIRRRVYVDYKKEIDRAYAELEGEMDDDEDKKEVGSVEEMRAHLFKLVEKVTGTTEGLREDTDLFTYGLDSLAAGRIRNFIQRDFNLGGTKLGTNFVFDYPTINLSASYLVAVAAGQTLKESTQVEQMGTLVEKYRHFQVPSRHVGKKDSTPSLAVVVLTGATGSLGAHILAALLARPDVSKVYCLVRASDNDLLGLSRSTYEEIATSVTAVLHNAWSVNFNLNISSFEPHIRGACNLIKLCLDSDYLASFYFASSVSAVASWPGPSSVPEAVTEDPNVAQGMGYARSKWVTEKLCQIATETTPVRAVVLRIGQMVGSTVDGRWNETEAVSLMFKTGDVLHALPNLNETPSWLPVDCAADTILDLVLTKPPAPNTSQCWHVLQSHLIPFSSALDSLAATGMKFERVSPSEWVDRLRKGPQDPTINPTIKLLNFFDSKYGTAPDPSAPVVKRYGLSCEETLKASKSLREAPIVDDKLMAKYVAYWRGSGFLKSA